MDKLSESLRLCGVIVVASLFLRGASGAAAPPLATQSFTVADRSEVSAIVHARCGRCAWGETGREAAVLRLLVDGKYSQHLVLARGDAADAGYRVMLGSYERGPHQLTIELDRELSARGIGETTISRVDVTELQAVRGDDHLDVPD